jgi:hypothetical protein
MIAEVPQGGLAWFMRGDAASVQSATDEACAAALAALGEREPLALIAFDCAARRASSATRGSWMRLDASGSTRATSRSRASTATARPGCTSGVPGFHNQTLVVLALS